MIGIYKITKIENGKSYIGQSNDIERRFKIPALPIRNIERRALTVERLAKKVEKAKRNTIIMQQKTK